MTSLVSRQELDPNELLVFADDDRENPAVVAEPWQVLAVIDDDTAHRETRRVVEQVQFLGRPVSLLTAYSADEAAARLRDNPAVAVILLDVVMESAAVDLSLVRTVRENFGNRCVRIIIRSNDSSATPPTEMLARYEINGYQSKDEQTPSQLMAALLLSLRDYRDIRSAERSREGTQSILAATRALFAQEDADVLARQVLDDLVAMLAAAPGSRGLRGVLAAEVAGSFRVCTERRWDRQVLGQPIAAVLPATAARMLPRVLAGRSGVFCPGGYIDVLAANDVPRHVLYLGWDRLEGESERDLVRVFMANATVAFRNATLRREISDTQREIIHTLSEVVETRSGETAKHVVRVGLLAAHLGELLGLSAADVEVLRMVAPMHDVGKVGIPDAILNKPGPLSPAERAVVETHTTIGHGILGRSGSRVLQAAAVVALQHHERWDGGGYPFGLLGEQIHSHARVTALADVVDALLQPRVYRPPLPVAHVRDFVIRERGRAFEPRLVDLALAHFSDLLDLRRFHPDAASRMGAAAGSSPCSSPWLRLS